MCYSRCCWSFWSTFIPMLAVLLLAICFQLQGQEEGVQWRSGPATVDLGENLAHLTISEDFGFTDGEATRRIMKQLGNPPTSLEIGMVVPWTESDDWFIVFEYNEVGYIRDDEKDAIDADEILQSFKSGTEAANEERQAMGFPPLHVLGWWQAPRYDEQSNNLVWALLAESNGDSVVNYNTRLLGRNGFVSAVLVAGPQELAASTVAVEKMLETFSYYPGRRYFEFVEGDRVAEYGLMALLAGGVGAAAAKTGLLAALGKLLIKFWKFIAIAFVALLGVIKRIFARLRGEITA